MSEVEGPEEMDPGFWVVHRDLPREGPGDAQSVLWALGLAETPSEARILDAGCGPGADALTLTQARPEARVEGIDAVAQFIEAARRTCPEAEFRVGDFSTLEGPYDLIWSAGAAYFLGVAEALSSWRPALAPGGRIAFSEPVWVSVTPSEAARAFWEQYPPITDLAGIQARVAAADYRVLGHRVLTGGPWRAYYEPMQARLDMLRAQGDSALTAAIAEAQREIDLWQAAPDEIAYALLVVAPE